jgi:hypothetical protein
MLSLLYFLRFSKYDMFQNILDLSWVGIKEEREKGDGNWE